MSRNQRIIISITGIVLVMSILIGLTYAYFLTRINGNTNDKSISVTTANLELKYDDIEQVLISEENVEPGKTWTKKFSATNTGSKKVESYGVALENVINTLKRTEDLVYTLNCTSSLGTDCNKVETEQEFPVVGKILITNSIESKEVQSYELTITYKEQNVDQSVDMNKRFSAKVNLVNPNTFDSYANSMLNRVIIDSAKTKLNGTEYLETPKTIPAEETSSFIYIKGTDPTSFTASRSSATSYYISYADDYTVDETTGKFTLVNPTVATAKYTTTMASNLVGKYAVWGTSTPTTSNTQNQSSIYKISNNVSDITSTIKYADVKSEQKSTEKELSITTDDYGMSFYYRGGVEDNYINFAGMCFRIVRIEGDGSIKIILEDRNAECDSSSYTGNWSDGNRIEYEKLGVSLNDFQTSLETKLENGKTLGDYLKKDGWCYNDNIAFTDNNGYQYYDDYKRIFTNKKLSLMCTGKYNYMYVGTLTADEVVYAGATYSSNGKFYLLKGSGWWLFSLAFYFDDGSRDSGDHAFVFDGSLDMSVVNYSGYYARPVISLKASTIIKSGNGTKTKPYTVRLS